MKAADLLANPNMLVDITDLAELCDITPRHMRRVLDDQRVPREHGKAPLRRSIHAYAMVIHPELHLRLMAEGREERLKERVHELEAEVRKLKRAPAKS